MKQTSRQNILNYITTTLMILISLTFIILGIVYFSTNLVLTTGTVLFDNPDFMCVAIENTNLYNCSFDVKYQVVDKDGSLKWMIAKIQNALGPRIRRGDRVYIQYDPKNYSTVIYGNTSFKTYGLLYLTTGTIILLMSCHYWSGLKNN